MVKIGDAISMSNPENESITVDDRQTIVQTLSGNVVQDFGQFDSGEKVSWQLQFDMENWSKVKAIWKARTAVNVEDNAGNSFAARVLIKQYAYVDWFRDHITATIEFWRV